MLGIRPRASFDPGNSQQLHLLLGLALLLFTLLILDFGPEESQLPSTVGDSVTVSNTLFPSAFYSPFDNSENLL